MFQTFLDHIDTLTNDDTKDDIVFTHKSHIFGAKKITRCESRPTHTKKGVVKKVIGRKPLLKKAKRCCKGPKCAFVCLSYSVDKGMILPVTHLP